MKSLVSTNDFDEKLEILSGEKGQEICINDIETKTDQKLSFIRSLFDFLIKKNKNKFI